MKLSKLVLFIAISLPTIANAAVCGNFFNNVGIVKRIYPSFTESADRPVGTYFRIVGKTSALNSAANGYYFIPRTANYSEMHNLVLEAAKTKRKISINTTNCTTPVDIAQVLYLVVDF